MKILVLNSGSSSIKYKLFECQSWQVIAGGSVEKIGEASGTIKHVFNGKKVAEDRPFEDHKAGLSAIAEFLLNPDNQIIENQNDLRCIGHRVVHGGDKFSAPSEITDEVKKAIRDLFALAPLHNPPNLMGIEVAEELFPQAIQVAIFDTAYHQSLPEKAFRYAIPNEYYEKDGIRRYGMHGTSHQFVVEESSKFLDIPLSQFNAISLHLGNGASITAVKDGKSIDTSLGLSPLPGLIMGTRSGDIDPAIIFLLQEKYNYTFREIDDLLNKKSGLKGLTGSNDLREVTQMAELSDPRAILALEMFAYRIKKYIGSYIAITGPIHALIFTAGVGENSKLVRKMVCEDLDHFGIEVNENLNLQYNGGTKDISSKRLPVKVLITPTDEELMIAKQTYVLVSTRTVLR